MPNLTITKNWVKIKHRLLLTEDEISLWRSRWPHFLPYELDSDDFSLKIYIPALDALESMRKELKKPIRITSAYRGIKHNKRVGGGKNSQHVKGKAFDIACPTSIYAKKIEHLAINNKFTAIGRYPKKNFIHIDMREPKKSGALYRWGAKWK